MIERDHHTRSVSESLDPTRFAEFTLAEREAFIGAHGMRPVVFVLKGLDDGGDDGGTSGGLGHLDLSFLLNLLYQSAGEF